MLNQQDLRIVKLKAATYESCNIERLLLKMEAMSTVERFSFRFSPVAKVMACWAVNDEWFRPSDLSGCWSTLTSFIEGIWLASLSESIVATYFFICIFFERATDRLNAKLAIRSKGNKAMIIHSLRVYSSNMYWSPFNIFPSFQEIIKACQSNEVAWYYKNRFWYKYTTNL